MKTIDKLSKSNTNKESYPYVINSVVTFYSGSVADYFGKFTHKFSWAESPITEGVGFLIERSN